MKMTIYKFIIGIILLSGIFVGIVKGQEARQKWVSKKKIKYETRKATRKSPQTDKSLVVLDEIEMSTYHS
jgi:hypothetical protein